MSYIIYGTRAEFSHDDMRASVYEGGRVGGIDVYKKNRGWTDYVRLATTATKKRAAFMAALGPIMPAIMAELASAATMGVMHAEAIAIDKEHDGRQHKIAAMIENNRAWYARRVLGLAEDAPGVSALVNGRVGHRGGFPSCRQATNPAEELSRANAALLTIDKYNTEHARITAELSELEAAYKHIRGVHYGAEFLKLITEHLDKGN